MKEIICKLNPSDDFTVPSAFRSINLTEKTDYFYNFWDDQKRKLYQVAEPFTRSAVDLFNISLMVYYADRMVLRGNEADGWTRSIKIYMPVLELDIWNGNKHLLEEMLSFLSGDLWKFEFRTRSLNEIEEKASKGIQRQRQKFNPDAICMLSGGLDSFIGAIDLLESSKNVCFVSHYGGGKGVKEYQNQIIDKLINEYSLSAYNFFGFHAAPVKKDKSMPVEQTTRTRSFMFFAHAIILGSGMNKEIKLYIPENGLISLNIPMNTTRLGSSSTRTTHPFYMGRLQELLNNIGLRTTLVNPYQFKTKGEMIVECRNHQFLVNHISTTMSCSHPDPRWEGYTSASHCGTCLPCVIRRASILKANVTDQSTYRDPNFQHGHQAQMELLSYKVGLKDFENDVISHKLKIQLAGPIKNDISEFAAVYARGMNELKSLIQNY